MHVPEGQLGGLHKEIQELRGLLERQGERQVELQGDVRAATEARRRAEQACDDAVRQAEAEAADLRLQVHAMRMLLRLLMTAYVGTSYCCCKDWRHERCALRTCSGTRQMPWMRPHCLRVCSMHVAALL